MNPQQNGGGYPQQSDNNYHGSIEGLAIVCAIAATLIAAPYINNFTSEFVTNLFVQNYGEGLSTFLGYLWTGLVYGFTYFLARIYVYGAVTAVSLWVVSRLPAFAF